MDFGTKIFGILLKHAIIYSSNGNEKVLIIVKHLQAIAIDKKNSKDDNKVINFNILTNYI